MTGRSAISCRQCGGAMSELQCGAVTIDRCAHCGGLWFGSALREVPRGTLAVHRCEGCHGVFVSRPALEAIRSAVRERDSAWSHLSIDLDFDFDLGAAAELPAEAVEVVLNFIGDLLEPLG